MDWWLTMRGDWWAELGSEEYVGPAKASKASHLDASTAGVAAMATGVDST
jgi:hypothetical protein